jgi:hypothetical protein
VARKKNVRLDPPVPGMQPSGAVLIRTNKDDKDYARVQDRWNCVFVRAIQRTMPEATFVRVDQKVVSYTIDNHRFTHIAPDELIDEIERPFDEGEEIDDEVSVLLQPPVTVKEVQRMTPEKRKVMRKIQRQRQAKEKAANPGTRREHNRFCDPEGQEV